MKKIKLVVVSLFDGMSGGRLAFDRVKKQFKVKRYYSSEIDKYAIKVADANYPADTPYRLGSVTDVDGKALRKEIRKEFGKKVKIMLIGGSPCQGFSFAGKRKGAATKDGVEITTLKQYLKLKKEGFEFEGQSYLFWEYIRIRKELKPDYFMLENVRMVKKWLDVFNAVMGVEPVMINSALVSAQNRMRYYWCNWSVRQPKDKGIVLSDILESGEVCEKMTVGGSKSYCITARYQGAVAWHSLANRQKTMVKCGAMRGRYIVDGKRQDHKMKTAGLTEQRIEVRKDDKTNCLTTVQKDNLVVTDTEYRKLTPVECERLQTVPDNYTSAASNTQRYKMLGNGWTIDVIAHILKELYREEKNNNI